jgi:hypothetical protein
MLDLAAVRGAWSWIGLDPVAIVRENDFGNIIVKDASDRYWRICPEELSCAVVANSDHELVELAATSEFMEDWDMVGPCEEAQRLLGPLTPGRKYCFKIPGVLGGPYSGENFGTIEFKELIEASGDLAEQIADVPDGGYVNLIVR